MTHYNQIKSWLDGRHIKVPEDWLEACLEWLQEENQGTQLTSDQLTSMVYDQWLVTDLHELQTSFLPSQIKEDKFMLQGFYCLQVDSLLDVSQPYYGQLQKVHGTENSNVLVTATQPTQPTWEAKSSRMLMLKLTDGTNNVQGMEYRPIPMLRTSLLPGCKLRIKGRILCRKGVMFLKSENVEILGGEVDSLIENNTQDKLLQNALASTDQSSRGVQRKEFQSNTPRPPQNRTVTNQGGTTLTIASRPQNQGRSNNSIQPLNRSNSTSANQDNRNSNFPDDEMEDDSLLESLATSELEALDQEWDVDMEDDSAQNRHFSVPQNNQSNTGRKNQGQPRPTGGQRQNSVNSGSSINQPIRKQHGSQSPSQSRPSQLGQSTASANQNHSSGVNKGYPGMNPPDHSGKSEAQKIADIETEMDDLADLMDDDFDDSIFFPIPAKKVKTSDLTTSTTITSDKIQVNVNKKGNLATCIARSTAGEIDKTSCVSIKDTMTPTTSSSDSCRTNSIHNSTDSKFTQLTTTNTDRHKITLPDFSQFDNPVDLLNHIRSNSKEISISKGCTDMAEPFVYISQVMPAMQRKEHLVFKLKAYVATLLSRLDSGQGEGWSLTCRLNDGTGTLDVDLSDEALTKLIGFSAKDSVAIKKGLKGDKSILSEGIRDCQLKLINISCIFTLLQEPYFNRPKVTHISPVTKEHMEQIYSRIIQKMAAR